MLFKTALHPFKGTETVSGLPLFGNGKPKGGFLKTAASDIGPFEFHRGPAPRGNGEPKKVKAAALKPFKNFLA